MRWFHVTAATFWFYVALETIFTLWPINWPLAIGAAACCADFALRCFLRAIGVRVVS